jgi:hypothetical protein
MSRKIKKQGWDVRSLDEVKFHLAGMLVRPPKVRNEDGSEEVDYTQLVEDIIKLFRAYERYRKTNRSKYKGK